MRQKLVSGARCAIRMKSYEMDVKKAVELLNRDLLNGPLHCFGIHSHCSTDFCTVARENQEPSNNNTQKASQHPLPIMMTSQHHHPPSSMRVGVAALMMKMMTTLKVCKQKVSEIKKI